MAITKLKALGVTDGTLTNTQINASAAIAKTKLASLDIVNADINNSAAIAFSKLTGVTNGITEADQWRVNATIAGAPQPIATNLERNDTNFQLIGTGLTQSSGVFSFPSTGIWHVTYNLKFYFNSADRVADIYIQETVDNGSNWTTRAATSTNGYGSGSYTHASAVSNMIWKCANISTNKLRFMTNPMSSSNTWVQGSTDNNSTYMTFLKLAEI